MKRRAPPAASLSVDADAEGTLDWLRGTVGLPADVVQKLDEQWQRDGQIVDGGVLLSADESFLRDIGCPASVASKIVLALLPSTQALAPNTQQALEEAGDNGEGSRPLRRGRSRPPAAQNGSQATWPGESFRTAQSTLSKQKAATQAMQVSQLPIVKPDPDGPEAQKAAAQLTSSRRRSQRQRSQPPESQQRQLVEQKQEPEDEEMADAEAEGEEEEEEQYGEGEEEDDEEEEEQASRRGRGRRQGSQPAGRRSASRVKEEPGVALEEHSMPLTGGRGARRAAADDATPSQQQQQQGGAADDEAGPSGRSGRMTTRRQAQRQEEQQQRRQLRMTTMHERQRRQEEADAETDDEDIVEEPAEEPEQAEQQEAASSDDDDEVEPVVMEDLGPAADKAFATDWRKQASIYLTEVFSMMHVEKLRELVEAQEEWPELAQNCLRHKKKVDGDNIWVDYTKPKFIARRLVNFLMTGAPDGSETEEGGLNRTAIKELLKDPLCDPHVQDFVENKLKHRYQKVPRTSNHHHLFWNFCYRPVGMRAGAEGERPDDPLEFPVLLGSRTLRYARIDGGANLEPGNNGLTQWKHVWSALSSGRMVLAGEEAEQQDDMLWLTQVNDFSLSRQTDVTTRLIRQAGDQRLVVYLYQKFDRRSPSASLLAGTWLRKNPDTEEEELVAVDMMYTLSKLDELIGTPFMEEMERLTTEYDATSAEVQAKGVPTELELDSPVNLRMFDKMMSVVEDIDRGEDAGFRQECDDTFKLTLRPYQRRSLAHMLREERAEATPSCPGGSARHLWVKMPLPGRPDLHAYCSPILHQIRMSISKIEAEAWVNANGGAGWIALQMGMGKSACAIGSVVMNPVPDGWRKNRAWQSLRERDPLASVVNNMPHGGTLIVMPPTLIDQWEDEIRKTVDHQAHPLSIYKWTDAIKGHPRLEAKEVAKYDIVLTTFNLASNEHTLSAVNWWRIIVDEPQLQAGGFLQDNQHTWFANHKWLLTGTPVNHAVDTLTPSLDFLNMGKWDALYSLYPPVATHVLKTFLVRYTKKGRLDGEENLSLPAVTYNEVEAELTDDDRRWYNILRRETRMAFEAIFDKLNVPMNMVGADLDPNWEWNGKQKMRVGHWKKIRPMLPLLRKCASSAYKQPTGIEYYDAAKGANVKEKYIHTSKAEAVIDVLKEKDPDEKVLIFSEYPELLRSINRMLPDIGLQSRSLIGSTSAAARGKAIRAFQNDPPTRVFLLTYKAGGAGVTLTAGTSIILCEPCFNPSFERQAVGRSHRMGQELAITVTRIWMKGTVEEKVKRFVEAQQDQEGEDEEEEALESTALEANQDAKDGSNRLGIEELRGLIYDLAEGEEEDDE